jgi:hypothetical protein
MKKLRIAAVTILLSLWLSGLESAGAQNSKLPARVEEVLWWLPEDTQTVVVAHGPFDKERFLDQREFLAQLLLDSEAEEGPLAGRSIALTVKGGRRFRSATTLGAWLYEGADIVIYDKPLGDAGAAYKKSLMGPEGFHLEDVDIKVEKIRGHDVIITREKAWDDVWTTYVTQPSPNVLIQATDRSYLTEMLARIEHKSKTRALPAHLPEWKVLDVTKAIWAIRHYDLKDLAQDHTSPRSIMDDEQGIGLVFEFGAAKSRVATVKFLTGHGDPLKAAKSVWFHPEENLTPVIRSGGPGVVDIAMTIEGPAGRRKSSEMFFFVLRALLGFGVNL